MTNLNELTDAYINDLAARNVLGWSGIYGNGGLLGGWKKQNGERIAICYFDPCNDWNDAFTALNALNDRDMGEFEEIITKPLNRYNLHELRENLNPRKLTESILKAVGVDVE